MLRSLSEVIARLVMYIILEASTKAITSIFSYFYTFRAVTVADTQVLLTRVKKFKFITSLQHTIFPVIVVKNGYTRYAVTSNQGQYHHDYSSIFVQNVYKATHLQRELCILMEIYMHAVATVAS